MDTFEALHPRAGGSGPGRTQFAAKEHQAPGITLPAAAGRDHLTGGLSIDPSALAPDLSEQDRTDVNAAIDRIRGAGVAGTVTTAAKANGNCDLVIQRGDTGVQLILGPSGIAVYRNDDHRYEVDSSHGDHMDAYLLSTGRPIPDPAIKTYVESVFVAARTADAWAKGNLRSNPEVRFGMPRAGDEASGGQGSISLELTVNQLEATIISRDGQSLSVYVDGIPLSARVGAAVIADAEETGGGHPGDMDKSLQHCRQAWDGSRPASVL